jgi:hypothetical protein
MPRIVTENKVDPAVVIRYLANHATRCPLCDSNTSSDGDPDMDPPTVKQKVKCDRCEATWTEIYTLSGMENLKT